MTIGKSTLTKLSFDNSTMSSRVQIHDFFQGELLHGKLCKIEEEQVKILRAILKNIAALTKEHEELRKTIANRLNIMRLTPSWSGRKKESGSILGQENSNSMLPLPPTIKNLFKDSLSDSVPQDESNLHEGRIRTFAHQRGNWSTYVYVPYSPAEGYKDLVDSFSTLATQAGIELKMVQDPHISLTRTVVLLHHWINSFVTSAKSKICHFPRFMLMLESPEVYCNEERTRTFLGLKVQTGSKNLCSMSQALDECLAEFRLPPFYKDPQFHISMLWVVGDAQSRLEALLPQFQAELSLQVAENPSLFHVDVTQCLCKSGNKMFTFPLANS